MDSPASAGLCRDQVADVPALDLHWEEALCFSLCGGSQDSCCLSMTLAFGSGGGCCGETTLHGFLRCSRQAPEGEAPGNGGGLRLSATCVTTDLNLDRAFLS